MADLHSAVRDLIDNPVRQPKPFEALVRLAEVRRRRRRNTVAVTAAIVIIAASVGGIVLDRGGATSTKVTVTGPPATSFRASATLAAMIGGHLELLNPTTGQVERSIEVGDSGTGGLAINSTGETAYITLAVGAGCDTDIISVDLATGTERVVADNAASPAVSPDGRDLAYVAVQAAVAYCPPGNVEVTNLTDGATRSWNLTPQAPAGQVTGQVDGLSWSPDGTQLAVGTLLVANSGIRFLDVTEDLSPTNPTVLIADGHYTSPQYLPDGNLVVVSPFCGIDAASCPSPLPGSNISSIDTLNPRTGRVLSVIPSNFQLGNVIVDPSGRQLAALAGGNLYRIDGQQLVLVKQGVLAAAWVTTTPTG